MDNTTDTTSTEYPTVQRELVSAGIAVGTSVLASAATVLVFAGAAWVVGKYQEKKAKKEALSSN